MTQIDFIPDKSSKFDSISKVELVEKYESLEEEYFQVIKENLRLKNRQLTDQQLKLVLEETLLEFRQDKFGASSERWKKSDQPKEKKDPKPRIKKPSERYPNVTIRNILIPINPLPHCDECGSEMSDSGLVRSIVEI